MNKNLVAIYAIAFSLIFLTRCSEDDIIADRDAGAQQFNSQADNVASDDAKVSNARQASGKYISTPITGTINGIPFAADFRITRFEGTRDALYAIGTLNNISGDGLPADVANLAGQQIKLPAQQATGSASAAAIGDQQAACDILFLQLGPLDLDLLGLVIHLDQVTLDIEAQPGSGNLLGNLLCAVTGLLDGPGAFIAIANLLNQIIDIIGVL
jgi:hypothetical protein